MYAVWLAIHDIFMHIVYTVIDIWDMVDGRVCNVMNDVSRIKTWGTLQKKQIAAHF